MELNKFNSYFNKNTAQGYRSINSEEAFSIPDVVKLVFDDIYIKYGDKCFKHPTNFTDHPLLENLFLEKEIAPNSEERAKSEKSCDEAFYQYLIYTKNLTNKNYFVLALKFVILFRECLNISRQKEIDSNLENGVNLKEYTAVRNAETVPEICNEFVTEYLENNDYFGIISDRDRNEVIELIQHFCTWLYLNGYTQSRLSLVS
jgi:hypothetical protein